MPMKSVKPPKSGSLERSSHDRKSCGIDGRPFALVLPFSKSASARDTHAYGVNAIGLERRGFSSDRIRKIHHAVKLLLASKLNTSQAIEKLKAEPELGPDVEMLIEFIEASERGVVK